MTASLPLPQDDPADAAASTPVEPPPLPEISAAEAAAAPPKTPTTSAAPSQAKVTPGTKAAAKKAPAKKTPAKKTPAKKTPAKKSGTPKTAANTAANIAADTAAEKEPAAGTPEGAAVQTQPAKTAEDAGANRTFWPELPPTVIVTARPDVHVWERTPPGHTPAEGREEVAPPAQPLDPDPVQPIESDPVQPPVASVPPAAVAEPAPAAEPAPVAPAPVAEPAVPAVPPITKPVPMQPRSDRPHRPVVSLAPAATGLAAPAIRVRGLTKSFGETRAVDALDLTVPAGSFYGIVGPNGAGKTTTLSMISGLLRPDRGSIEVAGVDLASDPSRAKRMMGVLPDRLRTFDRLTGRQLLYYYGVLRGLKPAVVESRTADLARAFDLTDALARTVADYSAGMTKKVMLAGAMIHSPRVLVLDEPFEAVDPVSSAVILDILSDYVAHGGTVVLSSHGMELVERVCSGVAVIVAGQVLAAGTVDEVRGELTLEQRFVELAGGLSDVEGLEWLHTFSD